MNKFIFLIINTIIFITGICSIIFYIPYLTALCLLLLSLLIIWNNNIINKYFPNNYDEDNVSILDNSDMLHIELSLQIQELKETNNLLLSENEQLKKDITSNNITNNITLSPMYNCALTSSLPINLNTFFSNYIVEHTNIGIDKKLHFDYHCDIPEAQTYLSGSALSIICNNALDNILKFSSHSENICLRITKLDSDNLIIFKNTCDGLPEAETEKVFDLNYMGSNKRNGNGLGLSQIKSIVTDFGGHVWAKSSKNMGFTLYIQLPEQFKSPQKETNV